MRRLLCRYLDCGPDRRDGDDNSISEVVPVDSGDLSAKAAQFAHEALTPLIASLCVTQPLGLKVAVLPAEDIEPIALFLQRWRGSLIALPGQGLHEVREARDSTA
ncbi:hypothetical protein [Streptomyces sp. NPDC051577]|uniref:hypothetical protein n=1 Tax=Streptomyces sp. NPDC051577 TaxID=3155166 RepID=UPI00343B7652